MGTDRDSPKQTPNDLAIGSSAAVFATFSWALNFVMPYVIGDYSGYDFITLRFLFSGLIGAAFVLRYRKEALQLAVGQIALACCLGTVGYLFYSSCIFGGVLLGGPVVTPAFVATVPIIVAIVGNSTERTLPWRKLAPTLVLAAVGLLLANLPRLTQAGSFGADLAFSLGAVVSWVLFSILNQHALARDRSIHSGAWTGLMMLGAGVATAACMPLGSHWGLYRFPTLGFGWHAAYRVYIAAFALACLASVAAAWAWNIATTKLPMVLSGQLIALETLFATAFGLIAESRLPTLSEFLGTAALVTGAVSAIRIVQLR